MICQIMSGPMLVIIVGPILVCIRPGGTDSVSVKSVTCPAYSSSTKRGVHTGAHCAHLVAAWGWCTRCAQPASMLPRSKYHARSGCHATRNHSNTGLQVNTENSNEFQFCASANVTMLQVCSSVHKKPTMFDFFIKLHS